MVAPALADKVSNALDRCNKDGYEIRAFEAWRSPARQDWLYAQGRTSPGSVVTKAKAWESWHQYGLAVDVAGFSQGKWSWNFDSGKIAPYFIEQGLTWLNPFEQSHFQLTSKIKKISVARAITFENGVQSLWVML